MDTIYIVGLHHGDGEPTNHLAAFSDEQDAAEWLAHYIASRAVVYGTPCIDALPFEPESP